MTHTERYDPRYPGLPADFDAVIAPAEDIVTLTGLLPEADRRTYVYLLKGVLGLVKVYAEGRPLEAVLDLTDETNICHPAVVAEAERALGLFEEKGEKPLDRETLGADEMKAALESLLTSVRRLAAVPYGILLEVIFECVHVVVFHEFSVYRAGELIEQYPDAGRLLPDGTDAARLLEDLGYYCDLKSPEASEDDIEAAYRVSAETAPIAVPAGPAVPVRDLTAALRKVGRKSRALFAALHNALFDYLREAGGSGGPLEGRLREGFPEGTALGPVLEQIRFAELASSVFAKDAKTVSVAEMRPAAEAAAPLAKLFEEKGEDHPLRRALSFLVSAAVAIGRTENGGVASPSMTARMRTALRLSMRLTGHADCAGTSGSAGKSLRCWRPEPLPRSPERPFGRFDAAIVWDAWRGRLSDAKCAELGTALAKASLILFPIAKRRDLLERWVPQSDLPLEVRLQNMKDALITLCELGYEYSLEAWPSEYGLCGLTPKGSPEEEARKYAGFCRRAAEAIDALPSPVREYAGQAFILLALLENRILNRSLDEVRKTLGPETSAELTNAVLLSCRRAAGIGSCVMRLRKGMLLDVDPVPKMSEREAHVRELARLFAGSTEDDGR